MALEAIQANMADNISGSKPRADVLKHMPAGTDTLYLIRLREDFDTMQSYFIKKMSDFKTLNEKVVADDKVTPADKKCIQVVPTFPEESRFGLRRQLSKLGVSDFMDRQTSQVHQYLSQLVAQVPNMAADKNVQEFFSGKTPEDEDMIKRLLAEVRAGMCLAALNGKWRPKDLDHVWTIEFTGKALLDGQYCGIEYDLLEKQEGGRTIITRLDGWAVDVERSAADHLVWTFPGQDDLDWIREPEAAPFRA